MKRVLVTGATGFIGRHALPLLAERGYEVHALVGASKDMPSLTRPDAPVDIAALVEEVRPSHLLHFAWYAVPGQVLDRAGERCLGRGEHPAAAPRSRTPAASARR